MIFLLASLALLLGGMLVHSHGRTRRLVKEVTEAIVGRHGYLPSSPIPMIPESEHKELALALNQLIRAEEKSRTGSETHIAQIRATLGAIRESIFIVDRQRVIQFANEFACENFGLPDVPLVGKRMEHLFQGADLMRFLLDSLSEGTIRRRELTIRSHGRNYCLEASSSVMEKTEWVEEGSVLLVMHDITRLKQLERMRKDFVANVSHELRTPLTIIKGYAETLRDDRSFWASDAGPKFIEKIVRNSDRLNLLLEDLLTLSRLESASNEVVREAVSVPLFLQEVVESYRERIQGTEKKICVECVSSQEDVYFDRFKLQQVLENLLENAFRHAPDFQVIEILAVWEKDRKELTFRFSDDGPGIPPRDLPHIFERFYRVDKGRSRERGGTGLGLSIMKHIIQLHGGRVWAESELGRGTTFFFTVPQSGVPGSKVEDLKKPEKVELTASA